MKDINPGDLNKRIKVYSFDADVETEDGAGGYEDNWDEKDGWTHVCDVWASIRPASERAREYAGQMMVNVTHTVLVRFNPLIKESHVINYNGRRLDIETIRNFDEADKYLQLMCYEDMNNG